MKDFLWVEKYRPKTIDDCVLPEYLTQIFHGYVKQGNVGNLLLSGQQGIGKTTVARALMNELDIDHIVINGSLEGRTIDTLRNDIKGFASTISFSGKRKFVILDEMDYLPKDTMQPALRNAIEEFSNNCGFIGTCNYVNRIIDPLHSRFSEIQFQIPNKEKNNLILRYVKRCIEILKKENIKYDKDVIIKLVVRHFPDFRKVLGELQTHSVSGSIDSSVLRLIDESSFKPLFELLQKRNFDLVREWVGNHVDQNVSMLFDRFYSESEKYLNRIAFMKTILDIESYKSRLSSVQNPEISMMAFLVNMMTSLDKDDYKL